MDHGGDNQPDSCCGIDFRVLGVSDLYCALPNNQAL